MCNPFPYYKIQQYHHRQDFHPLLAKIASATSNGLAKYIEYLKEETKILRARISGQIHTKHEERARFLNFGKVIGRAIEELMTIVSPSTSYRWARDEKLEKGKPKNPQGGLRKPKEIRELVIQIAKSAASTTLASSENSGNWESRKSAGKQCGAS